MRYIVHVRVHESKKRSYKIDAGDESEAIKRLMTRLAPGERSTVIVDAIEPDPASSHGDEPFGIFLNDNHN